MREVQDSFGAFHSDDYLYRRRGPWPQPAPDHPHGRMAGAVLHLPKEEAEDWNRHVGRRYLKQLVSYWPRAMSIAARTCTLAAIDDDELVRLMTRTLLSVFVARGLDERDEDLFAEVLREAPEGDWYKFDVTAMEVVSTMPGLFVAPTVTLLRRTDRGNGEPRFEVEAIVVEGVLIRPQDADAWELSKYFVLQGAGIAITLLKHPISHFPFDAINAITKTALPTTHPIFKLLYPHCRLQLSVNSAVLHASSSVLNQTRMRLYAPYPAALRDNLRLVSLGWTGIDGNRAYPRYAYPSEPAWNVSDYQDYLGGYWEVFLGFVCKVLANVSLDRSLVARWAQHVAAWVPGFPCGDRLFEGDVLARAIAMFMWNVSVQHCAEHYLYTLLRLDQVPLRLRVPPPPSRQWRGLDRAKLVTRRDQFRYAMCMKMFFANYSVAGLGEVDYHFPDRKLRALNEEFRRDLRAVDAGLAAAGVRNRVPLAQIATSIQY